MIGDTIREKIVSKCSTFLNESEREALWTHLFVKCVPIADMDFWQDPCLITNDLREKICVPVKDLPTSTTGPSEGDENDILDDIMYTVLIFQKGKAVRIVKFKLFSKDLALYQLISNIDKSLLKSVASVKFVALFSTYADYCIFLTATETNASAPEMPISQPLLEELSISERRTLPKKRKQSKKSSEVDFISILSSDEGESTSSLSSLSSNRTKIETRTSKKISKPNNFKEEELLLEYQGYYQQVSITIQDYRRLQAETYLNDVIVDFCIDNFLKTLIPKDQLDKIHVFSSFFYFRLNKCLENDLNHSKKLNLSSDERKYHSVKNWTKKVNIFEKDYLIIPINIQAHWILAIVCFPGLIGCHTIETNEPYDITNDQQLIEVFKQVYVKERKETKVSVSDYENIFSQRKALIKQPCLLFFDSMPRLVRKMKISTTIRSYLQYEYKAKCKAVRSFSIEEMPGCAVYVPRQSNNYDCGLFVLTYVEKFFMKPFDDYRIPIIGKKNWFNKAEVAEKRKNIANLIIEEIQKKNPEKLTMLPKINLPLSDIMSVD